VLALVLGLVSVCGAFACLVPILASPFAWYIGAKACREIDREPGRWSGRGEAKAGMVLGIVGTVLMVLAILALAAALTIALVLQSTTY